MKRILLSLIVAFVANHSINAQTYTHPTVGLQNTYAGNCMVNTCSGTYYDNGGAGANYSNSITTYRTFCPNSPGVALRVTFPTFNIENGFDFLIIRNGPTQGSPNIVVGTGTNLQGNTYTSTDASGCLTFWFQSDFIVNNPGWVANFSCVAAAGMPTGTENSDCINATGVCDNGFAFSGLSDGPGLTSDACTGCTVSENFSNWYEFTIATSGTLGFVLTPSAGGDDYDFALYQATSCGALGVPIRCSYSAVTGNTGMVAGSGDNSEDVTGDSFVETLAVVAGQHYYFMVNEWSPNNGSFTVNWTGTAVIATPPPLTMIGATDYSGSTYTVCQGTPVTITANGTGGTYNWYTVPVGGVPIATGTTYSPSTAAVGSTTYYLQETTTSGCTSARTAITITVNPPATVSAGADQTICAGSTATMAGTFGGGASSITWTTSGTGTFSSATATNAVYTPSAADISAGSVTITITTNDPAGPCTAVNDAMVLTINPAATVSANVDQAICAGSTVTLAGSMGGSATSVTWSTSGSGTFSNSSIVNPVYTPSAADVLAGTVTLTITSNDPAGPCTAVNDAMVVTINPAATVNAGADQTICSSGTATLTGSIGGSATSSTWTTSGTGTFANASAVNTTYTPSAADIAGGSVTLTLTTNNPAGPCNAVSDALVLTINPAATVSANVDQTICAGSTVTLAGSMGGGATTVTWSTSGSGTFSNSSIVNPVYTPSAADISGGTVTLTITTNDPAGPCTSVNDAMVVTINALPTVSASIDQTICAGSTATMAGTFGGGATSITWTTSGTGTFSSSTSTTAVYTPSAADISGGTVTLTITTNDPVGPCTSVNDAMVLTINPAATVSANIDQTICANQTVTLNGSMGGSATSITWTTSGTGTFSNSSIVNPVYTPSAADIAAGTVTLTITTNNPAGPCNAVSDAMVVTITPLQNASFAYGSATYCQTGIDPSPTVTGVAGGTFSSAPAGLSINPATGLIDLSASALNSYTITYTTPGPCANSSNVVVTITSAPSATFTYTTPVCQGSANIFPSFGAGASAGTFSAGAGLVFVNVNTGEINLATSTPGTYLVTNSIAASGGCAPATANFSVTIDPAAIVSAGADQTICAGTTATMAGTMSGSATSITWTTSGTGTFSSATALGAVYTPSAADIAAGTVTITITSNDPAGPCGTATDNMVLTINPVATVSAGADQTICAGSTATMAGTFGGAATSITWSSSGTGTFSSTTSVAAVYTPSAADIAAGTVTITITSNDPAGPCGTVTDNMVLTINPLAVVSAGADQTICAGSTATMAGTMSGGATSITWTTSGTGTFSSATALGAVYTPSAADIAAGTVTITITSNDPAGPCGAATDNMVLTINPVATVSAGPDQTICSGTIVTLAGTMGGSTTSTTWTSSGSGTFSNASSLTSTYTPSAADILAGTVTLTITSNDPAGPCNAVTDQMVITINPAAIVVAGPNQTICSGSTATMAGSMAGGATSITWTTSGTGTFSSATSTTAVYTPSVADIAAGTVTLTITSNDPAGPCGPTTDQLTLTINPIPTVNAGADNTICSDAIFTTAGSFGGGATSITWTTSGTGTFGSAVNPTTTYTPSAADIAAGTVTLTITSNDPAGPCNSATDNMVLTINPVPTVSAGVNASICEGSTFTTAGTSGGGATSVTWSTSGTGTFASSTNPVTVYTPSAADIASGSVTLTLTTNDPAGPCSFVTSSILLTIDQMPTTSAGVDDAICSGAVFNTGGTFGGSAGSITWTTSGTGTFGSASSANTTYTPSAADIAAGTVTLTITTDDPAGACTAATDNMVLTINPTPNPTAAVLTMPSACGALDGSIQISGLTGSTSYTISYDAATGTVNLGSVSTDASGNYVITGLGAGSYSNFTITLGPCTGTFAGPVSLTDPSAPVFTVGTPVNPTSCGGTDGSMTITGLNPSTTYTITYDGPSGPVSTSITTDASGNFVITGLGQGSYSNFVITVAGCSGTFGGPVDLFDPTTPNVNVLGSTDPTSCGGTDGTITLTNLNPSTAYTISYDGPSGTVSLGSVTTDASGNYVITGLGAGSYTNFSVTITGCNNVDASFIALTDPGAPVFTVGSETQPTACGAADGTITISGLSPSTSYDISYDNGAVVNLGTVTTDASGNYVITGLPAGSYTNFSVTAAGCTTVSPIVIVLSDPGAPTFTIGLFTSPTTCGGTDGLITLTGLTASTAYDISYDGPSGTVSLGTVTTDASGNYVITGLPQGTYSNFIVTLAGCSTPVAGPVVLNDPTAPAFTINAYPATVCGANDGVIEILLSAPSTNFNITYDGPTGTVNLGTVTTDIAGNYTLTGLPVGSYSNFVIIDATTGCQTTDAGPYIITDPAPPASPIAGTDATYCSGSPMADLTATGTPGVTLTWYSDPGLTTVIGTGATFTPFSTVGTTVYYVAAVSGTCTSAPSMVTITINTGSAAAPVITPDTAQFCADAVGTLSATAPSGGTIQWYSDVTLTTLIATGSTMTPSAAIGTVNYFAVENNGGCISASAVALVTIIDCDTIALEIPTGFTPDADGTNDVWDIPGLNSKYPESVVEVFTRWGAKIFTSDKGYTNPWDGTYNGAKMPLGAYYFVIYFNDDIRDPEKGTVTIVK